MARGLEKIAFGTNKHLLILVSKNIRDAKLIFLHDKTSEMKLVYADILTSNFFVIRITVKSRHHIDL